MLGFKQLHQLAQVSLLVLTQSKPSYLINILVKKGRKGHIVRPSNERETSVERLSSLSVSGDVRGGLGKLADTKLCHKSSHEIVSPCHNRRPTRPRSEKHPPSIPFLLQYVYDANTVLYVRSSTICKSHACGTHVTVAPLVVASSHVVGVRPTLGPQAAASASPSVAPCVYPKQTLLPNKHPCEEGKKGSHR